MVVLARLGSLMGEKTDGQTVSFLKSLAVVSFVILK